jgi:hypothetical protein
VGSSISSWEEAAAGIGVDTVAGQPHTPIAKLLIARYRREPVPAHFGAGCR